MSGVRSLYRGPVQKGYATAGSAPIRVDDSTNTIKVIPAGSGSTEVEVLGTVQAPTAISANASLTAATHGGRTLRVTVASGVTFTLPAATGSGVKFRIVIGILQTSNSVIVQVADNTDYMRGFALTKDDGSTSSVIEWATSNTATLATESDTITINRSTTGLGNIGDVIELEDIMTDVWSVFIKQSASGVEATPFSAAV